jgi:hypothetical protein
MTTDLSDEPRELSHAYPVVEEPRQAQFLGVLALVLLAFLLIGLLTGVGLALFGHPA